MFEATLIPTNNNDFWITIVFIFLFAIIVFQNTFFNKNFRITNFLLFNRKYMTIYFLRHKIKFFTLFQLLFFSIQWFAGGLLLFLLNDKYVFYKSFSGFPLFLLFTLFIALFSFLKYALFLFIGFLFEQEKNSKKLIYEKVLYFNNITIWLVCLLVFFYYSKLTISLLYLVYFIVFLILIAYYLIIKNNKNIILSNLFYFILYLCTFELAPLILIGKMIL